ncbi:MAG: hypothetical protein ACLUJG_15785 [Lawsonibacter sp.]
MGCGRPGSLPQSRQEQHADTYCGQDRQCRRPETPSLHQDPSSLPHPMAEVEGIMRLKWTERTAILGGPLLM